MGTFVVAAGLLGLWAGGMVLLASDARRRGVNVFDGLDAPRGYIRKPKRLPIDEGATDVWSGSAREAFWKQAREDASRTAARESLIARQQLLPGEARPSKKDEAEAGWKKLEAEFYASVRPQKKRKRASGPEARLQELRRKIAEAEARGDLIEAKRLSSEARFIVTDRQNRLDAEEDAQKAGNRNPLGRRIG